ncbi:SKI family transcriptional corepressor 2 [Anopheles marshallii]|uniref:SKI family transcriptional corepressor 2 n=1 Tax=Anopheles marshallii TaxID=1521116 RepID=UPI00237A3C6B|nr:SKI family transcriptional corepressor 2 [Anopheles marshallii]
MRSAISIGLLILVIVQCTLTSPVPQFLTFRDGKFGVNFGGYHAEAGLGGLLTGNSAHGGLSASAGTPHGQQAGAGIGGLVGGNERTAGGAYAGATAGHGVGASAAIGGGLDGAGGAGGVGAESHAGGVSKKVVRLGQTNHGAPPSEVVIAKETGVHHEGNFERIDNHQVKELHTDLRAPAPQPAPTHTFHKTVYKKKVISHPHKVAVIETHHTGPQPQLDINRFFDFQTFTNLGAHYAHPAPPPPPPPPPAPIVQKTLVKQVSYQPVYTPTYQKEVHTRFDSSNGHSGGGSSSTSHVVASSTHNANFWNDIFNIPISTLTAVNQLLNNKAGSGSLHVEKHVEVH